MLIYISDKNYGVNLNEYGDYLWIIVTNGQCMPYECCVGCVSDGLDMATCAEIAYNQFVPGEYVMENLDLDDDHHRVLDVAKNAYEIGRALEMAMSA